MAFDFPSSPTPGTVFTPAGGPTWQWDGTTWLLVPAAAVPALTAESRNRIVNGAMQVSQENANTASASAATGSYWFADQWIGQWSTTGASINARSDLTTLSPNNCPVCLFNIVTAGTMPAGGYMDFTQRIEGRRVADFGWGAAGAKQAVLRFWVYAPAAGTYSIYIQNGARDRSYIAAFTVTSANTWQAITLVVPGDTTGVWPKDTTMGMELGISCAVGSTVAGSAGWQAGAKYGLTGQANGAGTTGIFMLADVGLYLDRNNTGLPPPWQMPDEAQELAACQRYYANYTDQWILSGIATGVQTIFGMYPFRVRMRTSPAVAALGVAYTNAASIGVAANNVDGSRLSVNSSAAGGFNVTATNMTINARM